MNPASTPAYEKLDLVFTIVPHGLAEKVVALSQENGVPVNLVCPGRGTATSGILEMFGLGATDKDVVLSFVRSARSSELLKILSGELDFDRPGSGVAFSVPFQSIAGSRALHYFTTSSSEEEKRHGN